MLKIVPVCMVLAGFIHLWIAPEHWQHSPTHGMIFILLGIAQLLWSWLFLSGRRLQATGIILASFSIFLWLLTRILPAPFEEGPESLSVSGVIVKLLELAALAGLAFISLRNDKTSRWNLTNQLIAALVISLVFYTSGRAAEKLFPDLKEKEGIYYEKGHEH